MNIWYELHGVRLTIINHKISIFFKNEIDLKKKTLITLIMIDQVVCFNCGKVISHIIEKYREIVRTNDALPENKQKTGKEILDELGLRRYCCRAKVLSSINISYELPFVF